MLRRRSTNELVAVPLLTVSFIMSRSVAAVSGLSSRTEPVGSVSATSEGSIARPPLPTAPAISAACSGESFTSPNPAALLAKSSPESGMLAFDCSIGWSKMGRLKRNRSASLRRSSPSRCLTAILAKTTLALLASACASERQRRSRRGLSCKSLLAMPCMPPW